MRGLVVSFTTVSNRCPPPFGTSRGKRRSGSVRDIADWPHPASRRSSSPLRSPARWSALFGRSPASPSRRSIDRNDLYPWHLDRVAETGCCSQLREQRGRRWREELRSCTVSKPCGFAAARGRHLRVAHNSTGPTTVIIDLK